MSAKVISDKNFAVSLKQEFSQVLGQNAPQRVALLITCEYEGIYRNGGIGTYYRTLSDRLAEENWYVILLLFCVEDQFLGSSTFPAIQHIFSTQAIEKILNLQPIHLNLLSEVKHDTREYESLCCLLFTQAITSTLPNSQVYVEFPEMTGIGYRTVQAKHTGALGGNCVVAVTMHSGYEWVFEANERFVEEHPEPLWQIYSHEQTSFEEANLVFFPSYALKQKVESYGWQAIHAQHMPYFVPQLAADPSAELDTHTTDSPKHPSPDTQNANQSDWSHLIGMTSLEERAYLQNYAQHQYTGKGEIVDLGCWLGSLTVPLAVGLRHNLSIPSFDPVTPRIHAYDIFIWQSWMEPCVQGTSLVGRYQDGDSFLDTFLQQILPWKDQIAVYPGDLNQIGWAKQAPIEFLLIDAMKNWSLSNSILKHFFPFLVPGLSLIQHQDFVHFHTSWIHLIMYRLRDYFEPVCYVPINSYIFRYIKKIPDELLAIEYSCADFSEAEIKSAFNYSLSISPPEAHRGILAAMVMTFIHATNYEAAKQELAALKTQGIEFQGSELVIVETQLLQLGAANV